MHGHAGRFQAELQRRAQVLPPSTGMTAPVMKLARSDARNDASSATSSGWPARFIAAPSTSWGKLSIADCPPDSSVTISPGQIALARMPLAPYSTAAALVNAMTPAFAALYTLVGMSDAFKPPIDDQLMMEPPPVARIAWIPCLVPSSTPRR